MAETVSDINGGNNDYATLILWEADKDGDITAGNAEVAEVYADITETTVDLCFLNGWTTDADSYIEIRNAASVARDSGNPLRAGQAVALIQEGTTEYCIAVYAGAEFTRIRGLDCIEDDASCWPCILVSLGASTTVAYIEIDSVVATYLNDTSTSFTFVETDDNTAHVVNVYNCVGHTVVDGLNASNNGSDRVLNIYNSTFYGAISNGIERTPNAGTVNCYNVICYNNTGNDFEGAIGGDYNMSEDATAPGANSLDSGTGGNSPDFVNTGAGTEDFHVQATGDGIGAGTDDPGSGLYSDDVDGTARSSTWDMGAAEFVAAGGVAPTGTFYGPLVGPFGGVIG